MKIPKRVGIYARVSTKDQTVANQLNDLRIYCKAREWQIVGEFVDEGVSGAQSDRVRLNEIMTLAHKRQFDVLLVWRFDRFARSLSHLVHALDDLRALGVDFVSYQEGVDTSTAQGRMVFGVMASLAEFERALIQERILSGLRRAKAEGKRSGPPRVWVDLAALRRLRQDGRSLRQMALTLSVGKSTVQRLLSQIPAKIVA